MKEHVMQNEAEHRGQEPGLERVIGQEIAEIGGLIESLEEEVLELIEIEGLCFDAQAKAEGAALCFSCRKDPDHCARAGDHRPAHSRTGRKDPARQIHASTSRAWWHPQSDRLGRSRRSARTWHRALSRYAPHCPGRLKQWEPPQPATLRRQFSLPADDQTYLDGLALPWEAVITAGQRWILVYGETIPAGYNCASVDVAIMMAPGYPPGPLDMAYFNPPLIRANGIAPRSSEGRIAIDGKAWQGWSRHRTADNPWRPGEDNLESHYFYLRAWLVDELKR